MFEVNGHNVIIIVGVCFLASLIFVKLSMIIAKTYGIMDMPGVRRIHKKPMPRFGGFGIILSFLLGYMLFAPKTTLMLSVLISSFLISFIGMLDDMKTIPAKAKWIFQIIITSIIVFYGNLYIDEISVLGLNIYLGNSIVSKCLSIFILLATTNAINLTDGMDGLCGGISSIYFATIAIIGMLLNDWGGMDVILSLIMLGATLGFLFYNFPPAKTFMGDTGSTFLGLIVGVIMLLGFKTVTLQSLVIPLLILALPCLDTLFAIIRRLISRRPIFSADQNHIHHQLLKRLSTKKSLLTIYSIDIIFSITSVFYALGHPKEMIVCYILLIFIVLFLIFKTNVIFENKKEKKKR